MSNLNTLNTLITLLLITGINATYAADFKTFNYGQAVNDGLRAAQQQMELQRQQEEILRIRLERERLEAEYRNTNNDKQPSPPPQSDFEKNTLQRYQEAIKFRKYRFEDFDKVTQNPNIPISFDMVGMISESRYAADIVYYLCKNPDKSEEIFKMPLPDAGKAILNLEKKIASDLSKTQP